ncbi:hypothetical protein, partial [Paraburkholderia sp. GAS333]|uniref:hypothetical protein n=1 Tax=Paraburkholderia sp. GAS333 TaxID=3156279 RepID=UPI003D20B5FD
IVRIARVKVGNRQAPQQHQKPHPAKVGFLRLQAKSTPHVNSLSCPSLLRLDPQGHHREFNRPVRALARDKDAARTVTT